MYALNIDKETNRILSACVVLENGDYANMLVVEALPDGDITDYMYIDGEYVYDPLPEPDPVEPAPSDSERIDALEQQMAALIGGVADVQ